MPVGPPTVEALERRLLDREAAEEDADDADGEHEVEDEAAEVAARLQQHPHRQQRRDEAVDEEDRPHVFCVDGPAARARRSSCVPSHTAASVAGTKIDRQEPERRIAEALDERPSAMASEQVGDARERDGAARR